MARWVSSRPACPTSTLTYTQRYPSSALSRSRNASREEVLPVWRGACSTKYFSSRTRASTSARFSRSNGAMQ